MPSLIRFVHRTRRAWIVRQIFEWAAIGFAAGGAMAIALLAIQLLRAQSALSIGILFPLIGLFCGAALAVGRLPSMFAVVQRIDQVSGNDDLLSTAWNLQASSDPWHRSITSLAATRCIALQPAAIIPSRIGKRGWSAITLTACLVSALSALSMIGNRTTALAAPNSLTQDDSQNALWTKWTTHFDSSNSIASFMPPTAVEAKAEPQVDSRNPMDQPQNTLSLRKTESRPEQTPSQLISDQAGAGLSHTAGATARLPDWTTVDVRGGFRDVPAEISSAANSVASRDFADSSPAAPPLPGAHDGDDQPAVPAMKSSKTPEESVPFRYQLLCHDYFSN